jgi:hypothetical protein
LHGCFLKFCSIFLLQVLWVYSSYGDSLLSQNVFFSIVLFIQMHVVINIFLDLLIETWI